jgi:hypothetical protein
MTTDNFCFYLQNRLIQTSQTGGQQYSDTSPFNIPCPNHGQLQSLPDSKPQFNVFTIFAGSLALSSIAGTQDLPEGPHVPVSRPDEELLRLG